MLNRRDVDEAKKLLDLDDALKAAIKKVELPVWRDNMRFDTDAYGG